MNTKRGFLPWRAKPARTFLLSSLQGTGSCIAQHTQDWSTVCHRLPIRVGFYQPELLLLWSGGIENFTGLTPAWLLSGKKSTSWKDVSPSTALCVQGTVRADPKGLLTHESHPSFMMKKKESEVPGGEQLPGKRSDVVTTFAFFHSPIKLLPSLMDPGSPWMDRNLGFPVSALENIDICARSVFQAPASSNVGQHLCLL